MPRVGFIHRARLSWNSMYGVGRWFKTKSFYRQDFQTVSVRSYQIHFYTFYNICKMAPHFFVVTIKRVR